MKKFLRIAVLFLIMVNITPINAKAASGSPLIALTFDDGPHKIYTAQLLDGLKERGVSATFFMLGQCAQENPELVRRAYEEGHEIACHTWSHPNLNKLSEEKIRSQIRRCKDVFDQILGEGNEYLLRPPYGNANRRVRSAVKDVMVLWSVDTLDWKLKDEEQVYQKIITEAHDGAIILCHDIHSTTIPAALRAVDTLEAEGYELVTVSELMRRRGVEPVSGKLYDRCAPGAEDPGAVPEPEIRFQAREDGSALVTIESGLRVRCSVDGEEARLYQEPFVVEDGATVRAAAVLRKNGGWSREVSDRWEAPCQVSVPAAPRVVPAPRVHRDLTEPEDTGSLAALVIAGMTGLGLTVGYQAFQRRRRAARRRRKPRVHIS